MIRKIVILSAIASSSLFATNGVNLIGTGTVSRSMGGTGVAYYSHSVEAINRNPALMANTKDKNEFQMDYTFFSASVTSSQQFSASPVLSAGLELVGVNLESLMDEVRMSNGENSSLTHYDAVNLGNIGSVWRLNEKWVFGVGFIGAAGLGVDHVESPALRKFKTALMIAKLVPAFSYQTEKVNFGFAPVIGFGSMSINYDEDLNKVNSDGEPLQSTREGLFGTNIGGETLVPALGYQVGMEIKITDDLTFGQTYHSAMSYTYKEVANFEQFGYSGLVSELNSALVKNGVIDLGDYDVGGILDGAFSEASIDDGTLDDLQLEQPWELALGLAYDMQKNLAVTFDYRHIAWGSAAGYKDFGWSNQNVYAIGFDYHKKKWSLRAGYNYAKSPLAETSGEAGLDTVDVQGHTIFKQARTMLSTVGFPAIATTHFTIGGAYALDQNFVFDFALVHSPEVKYTATGSLIDVDGQPVIDALGSLGGGAPDLGGADNLSVDYEYTTTMSQTSVSFGINYLF